MKSNFLIFFFLIIFSSCVSINYTEVNKAEEKVELYILQQPTKAYKEIGYIEIFDTSLFHKTKKQSLKQLKQKAIEKGADAIIGIKFSYIYILIFPIPKVEGIAIRFIN
jgi:hypothetical protein